MIGSSRMGLASATPAFSARLPAVLNAYSELSTVWYLPSVTATRMSVRW